MKIGLNDPKNKSIVLSTTEFSADELGEAKQASPPKSKKKRKSRRNTKPSQTRPIKTDITDIQTSIIKEEDDGDEQEDECKSDGEEQAKALFEQEESEGQS